MCEAGKRPLSFSAVETDLKSSLDSLRETFHSNNIGKRPQPRLAPEEDFTLDGDEELSRGKYASIRSR